MKRRQLRFCTAVAAAIVVLGCTIPAWVNTVESDAEVAVPIAASLISVVDPALAPQVSLAESGFTALINTLDTYKASPTATNLQAVQSAFAAVDKNVAQLESAAQIKNAGTQATATAVVQLLAQAVTEIAAQFPAGTKLGAASAGPATRSAAGQALSVKGWKATDLKKRYNAIVKDDPRFKPLP